MMAILFNRKNIPFVSSAVAIGITIALGMAAVSVEREAGRLKFRRLAEKFQVDLSNQIQAHIDTIPTIKAFAVLEGKPTDDRVQQFISAISLQRRFPNISFILLADRVKIAARDDYVANVRNDKTVLKEGRRNFAISPPGERDEYMVLRHVAPESPNTIGYDLYDPTQRYRKDVDLAVASGQTIASGPIVLAKDRMLRRSPENTSIVVREAVYAKNIIPATAAARAEQLIGMVGIAFKTKTLIDYIVTPEVEAHLVIRISDAQVDPSELPLYETSRAAPSFMKHTRTDTDLTLEIPVANRRWIIAFHDRISPTAYWGRPVPLIVFGSGAIISILLFLLMRALVTRTSIAEAAVEDALSLVREEQAALKEAQSIAAIGSFEWREHEKRLYWSAQMAALYGCTADEFLADPARVVARVPKDQRDKFQAALGDAMANHMPLVFEHQLKQPNGQLCVLQLRSKWQHDQNSGNFVLTGTAQDVTALRKHEAEITHLAFVDSLTGLPNRRRLIEKLSATVDDARRRNVFHALLFVDLDNFKIINDTKGHAIGDQMLAMAAKRLQSLVSEIDLVARIGGDEFVIMLMTSTDSVKETEIIASSVAERLRNAMADPFTLDGIAHASGASIGVSIFPQGSQQYTDIFREADTAMYRSKFTGRDRVTIFEPSMQADVELKASFGLALADAVRNNLLHLVAQSQFDMQRRPCGSELLLRWTDASGAIITPDRFIPVAEETGLIVQLGAWVFEQACAIAIELDGHGCDQTISINVSPRQFRQRDFVDYVRETGIRLNVPFHRLVFEVTEGLLIEDVVETAGRMRELNALGIRFSIDDFGTGYSSLSYLRDLPLYEIKIDKSFIQAALSSNNDAAIVKLMLGIAKQLNIKVVAEGVETDAQFEFLAENGCDVVQGFLLARPVPVIDWVASKIGNSV